MDWMRGRTIGRGSSATVSVASSLRSGDIFAVKSVELHQSEVLQREQQFLSSLSNPRIVGYKGYDITSENNKLMYNLKMEYAAGGMLVDAIQEQGGRLEESMIGYYTHEIVQGLEYLHSSGIVHCDIKGRNILIGKSCAKIADLGCAKWVNHAAGATDPGCVAAPIGGTPPFMAPEVARGEEQGFPADIWALGCTIIEMAGWSPWPNVSNPISVLHRIAFSGELPEFPNSLSDKAKDFLSKCLRRDPKERWMAQQLLKHPFLEEFNSHAKQSQDFDTSTPTSILDQGYWNSMEDSETMADLVQTSSVDSPEQRIRQLALNSGVPNWRWDETWITIRRDKDASTAVCGSVTASISHDLELERKATGKSSINLLDTNVSCSNSNILTSCTCIEHIIVKSSLNFERHREEFLVN